MTHGSLKIAGWREWASFPDLDVHRIKAKLDTGARTSALHVFDCKTYEKDGKEWVSFDVHPIQEDDAHACKTCFLPILDRRVVTSSTGHREHRIIIETQLEMGDEIWPIQVSLTNRDQMGFRLLIGRTALEHRLVVDPARSYLVSEIRHRSRKTKPSRPRA